MIGYVLAGGYAMWGVLLCGTALVLMLAGAARGGSVHAVDAVLVWAVAALAVGVIGTLLGVSQVAGAMRIAQGVSPELAREGVRMSLSTTIVGASLFLFGLAGWGLLRLRGPSAEE